MNKLKAYKMNINWSGKAREHQCCYPRTEGNCIQEREREQKARERINEKEDFHFAVS